MSTDETSSLTAANNIYVFSFSSPRRFVCVCLIFSSHSFLYLYSSRKKETGDVDGVSMSIRSNGSCSTQLSCQHPNSTVDSTAVVFVLDIAFYSVSPFFFLSLLLVSMSLSYLSYLAAALVDLASLGNSQWRSKILFV